MQTLYSRCKVKLTKHCISLIRLQLKSIWPVLYLYSGCKLPMGIRKTVVSFVSLSPYFLPPRFIFLLFHLYDFNTLGLVKINFERRQPFAVIETCTISFGQASESIGG